MTSAPPAALRALALGAPLLLAACGGPPRGTPRAAAATTPVAAVHVTTGDRSLLLHRGRDVPMRPPSAGASLPTITVDADRRHQTVVGWGAAMTDAAAHLIQERMSSPQREALLLELFGRGPDAIGLSFVRVPIGASDFSRSHYSHADLPPGETDPALARFSIAPDRAARIPLLRRALAINPQLRLVGSPWSPPAWMKTGGSLIGGTLRPEFHGAFAEYLARWVEAYEAEGLPVLAVTLQNEPHHEPHDYPGMRLDPARRAELIRDHVGPLFAARGLAAQLWEWDHNWDEPDAPLAVLGDPGARPYVRGVAWHCYAGDVSAQALVHDRHPEVDTYFTECSGGEWAPVWADNLRWNVANLVIGTARGWARGVALWNLALDERHGPHLGGCANCRGVVTIHAATGEVTRNVEYYALAHASRFVRPGAARIASTMPEDLANVAFRNADDGSRVLIVLNGGTTPHEFAVRDGGRSFTYTLAGGAVATFTWSGG